MPSAGIEPAVSERVTLDRSAIGMAAACIDDRSNCVMIGGGGGDVRGEKLVRVPFCHRSHMDWPAIELGPPR
jgi:hypothetical protein